MSDIRIQHAYATLEEPVRIRLGDKADVGLLMDLTGRRCIVVGFTVGPDGKISQIDLTPVLTWTAGHEPAEGETVILP